MDSFAFSFSLTFIFIIGPSFSNSYIAIEEGYSDLKLSLFIILEQHRIRNLIYIFFPFNACIIVCAHARVWERKRNSERCLIFFPRFKWLYSGLNVWSVTHARTNESWRETEMNDLLNLRVQTRMKPLIRRQS